MITRPPITKALTAYVTVSLLLTACSSGGSSDDTTATATTASVTIQGQASKGSLLNAQVTASNAQQDTLITSTDAQGRYSLQLPADFGSFTLNVSGGQLHCDAPSGCLDSQGTLHAFNTPYTNPIQLSAVLPALTTTTEVNLTPLTSLAHDYALTLGPLSSSTAQQANRTLLNQLTPLLDSLQTPLTQVASQPLYALSATPLTALDSNASQLQQDLALIYASPLALVDNQRSLQQVLAEFSSDSQDGQLDASLSTQLTALASTINALDNLDLRSLAPSIQTGISTIASQRQRDLSQLAQSVNLSAANLTPLPLTPSLSSPIAASQALIQRLREQGLLLVNQGQLQFNLLQNQLPAVASLAEQPLENALTTLGRVLSASLDFVSQTLNSSASIDLGTLLPQQSASGSLNYSVGTQLLVLISGQVNQQQIALTLDLTQLLTGFNPQRQANIVQLSVSNPELQLSLADNSGSRLRLDTQGLLDPTLFTQGDLQLNQLNLTLSSGDAFSGDMFIDLRRQAVGTAQEQVDFAQVILEGAFSLGTAPSLPIITQIDNLSLGQSDVSLTQGLEESPDNFRRLGIEAHLKLDLGDTSPARIRLRSTREQFASLTAFNAFIITPDLALIIEANILTEQGQIISLADDLILTFDNQDTDGDDLLGEIRVAGERQATINRSGLIVFNDGRFESLL